METSDPQPLRRAPVRPARPSSRDDGAPARGAALADRTRRRDTGGGSASPRSSSRSGCSSARPRRSPRRDDVDRTNVSAPPSTAPTGVEAATAQQPKHRALTVDDPLRLWIGGDSLAGSLGPSLGQLTAATGVVAPRFDSRVSTGLTSPAFFDWPKHATEEMAKRDPEAVVFIIGTNDANTMPDLATADDADDHHRASTRRKVEQMMQIFIGDDHRPVYWVATPPMKDTDLDANVDVLNARDRRGRREAPARSPSSTSSAEFSDSRRRLHHVGHRRRRRHA